MNEYQFLRMMFFRLREAERCAGEAKMKDKKDDRHKAWVAAIEGTIRDYLELREAKK